MAFYEKKNHCLLDSYWMVFQIKTLVRADNNTIFNLKKKLYRLYRVIIFTLNTIFLENELLRLKRIVTISEYITPNVKMLVLFC